MKIQRFPRLARVPIGRALLWIWLLVALAPAYGARAEEFKAGLALLSLTDPVEGGPMPVVVAYPALSDTGPTTLGLSTVAASRDTPPVPGRHPLVVVSHGTGGSNLVHHDSLVALAKAGFVAVAVEHPRDNFRDDGGFGTDLQLAGRSHHIVATIDGVLAHPMLGALIDADRIGMAGHSAGGYTALTIAGGVPNPALREAYARAVPDDPMLARLPAARAAGPAIRKPGLVPVADPRVRALVLWAPALGYLFDEAALAHVRLPVRLYRAGADEFLPHPWNVERVARTLPTPPEYQTLEGAGHFVFLAPCAPSFAARVPAICADPPGIDRAAIHTRLNAEMIAFLLRAL